MKPRFGGAARLPWNIRDNACIQWVRPTVGLGIARLPGAAGNPPKTLPKRARKSGEGGRASDLSGSRGHGAEEAKPHSSGTPALRSPAKYVASYKARVFGDIDLHPPGVIFAMLEKEPLPLSLRASVSWLPARSKSPLRAYAAARLL